MVKFAFCLACLLIVVPICCGQLSVTLSLNSYQNPQGSLGNGLSCYTTQALLDEASCRLLFFISVSLANGSTLYTSSGDQPLLLNPENGWTITNFGNVGRYSQQLNSQPLAIEIAIIHGGVLVNRTAEQDAIFGPSIVDRFFIPIVGYANGMQTTLSGNGNLSLVYSAGCVNPTTYTGLGCNCYITDQSAHTCVVDSDAGNVSSPLGDLSCSYDTASGVLSNCQQCKYSGSSCVPVANGNPSGVGAPSDYSSYKNATIVLTVFFIIALLFLVILLIALFRRDKEAAKLNRTQPTYLQTTTQSAYRPTISSPANEWSKPQVNALNNNNNNKARRGSNSSTDSMSKTVLPTVSSNPRGSKDNLVQNPHGDFVYSVPANRPVYDLAANTAPLAAGERHSHASSSDSAPSVPGRREIAV